MKGLFLKSDSAVLSKKTAKSSLIPSNPIYRN